jgi:hypothetical protein
VSTLAFWVVFRLLADTEFADHVAIAIRIVRLQVIQQTAALADQLQKTSPGSVILLVGFEMLGQFANPLTQNGNLDFRRAGVRFMSPETFDQGCFLCGRQHGVCYSSCLLSPLSSVFSEITMNARGRAMRRPLRWRPDLLSSALGLVLATKTPFLRLSSMRRNLDRRRQAVSESISGMTWEILISIGLLAAASIMAWMGVRVSLYPLNTEYEKRKLKRWFIALGVIASVLTIAQGIRNGISQRELLDEIAKNKPVINVQPAPVTVNNLPAPPPPLPGNSKQQPQISAETFPEKATPGGNPNLGNDKPGVSVLITAHTVYRSPVIEMKCSVPCKFIPVFSFFHGKYMTSTMTEQLASPPNSPDTIRVRLVMPVKFEPDEQLSLEFRSTDNRELAITGVRPYLGAKP